MNREVLPGETYRHFKGHIIKVVCIAKNTETLEDVVVYHHIKNDEYWVRPLEMFNSLVDKTNIQMFHRVIDLNV